MWVAGGFLSQSTKRLTLDEEARFFTSLKTANATFKTTSVGRFSDVDSAIVEEFAMRGRSINLALDIGISAGITTRELVVALRQAGHAAHMTGTDRSLSALIVDLAAGCRALVEPSGHILQYDLVGFALRPWYRRLDYFTGAVVLRALVNRLFAAKAAREARRQIGSGVRARSVRLVSRGLMDLGNIEVIEDDVTRSNPRFEGRFDFIRAANVLNLEYFGADELSAACVHLRRYLSGPGSMLLLIRTVRHGRQEGTLFCLAPDGRLEVVRRFGQGSEVEALALAA